MLRQTSCVAALSLLAGMVTASLRAEDLSRWVWVAQAPEATRTTESIPTPRQMRLECPTLEQLGYPSKQLGNLSMNVSSADERLPVDCSNTVFQPIAPGQDGRNWFATEFTWAASDLFAQPAYFDDPLLERYGQTRHPLVQPWLSGAHFFGQFPLMPYRIVVDRPFDKVYTLGYHRPGSPMPLVARRLPRP